MIRLASCHRSFCHKAAKPFESIPGPKLAPIVGSFFDNLKKFKFSDLHLMTRDRVKNYGKIYKDKILNFSSVSVACPRTTAAMYRNEGKYPKRLQVAVWQYPRRKRGIPLSVLLSDGEDWYRMRRAIDKQLMTLSNVYKYIEPMNGIADDFIRLFTKSSGDHLPLKDLALRWSTESVCLFLYDLRIGCLSDNPPPDALMFANAVETVLRTSVKIFALSPTFAKILTPFTFRKHVQSWYTIFDIGKVYMNKKLSEIDEKTKANQEVDGFLASLKSNPNITTDEMFSITVELMSGGIDTTATTLLWFLHLLATNPDKQELLHKELTAAGLHAGSQITEAYIKHAPYLKACLKESMRLRPIIIGTGRYLPEETVLDGYNIPSTCLVLSLDMIMASNEEYYHNPTSFLPERCLPFGFGPRGCVGRRLAELEIYILVAKIISQFQIVNLNKEPIEQEARMILSPKVPVEIKFVKRSN